MKKTVLFLIVFACFSCEKPVSKEWGKLYGYTNDDIVGRYVNSGVADAFAGLAEGNECHLCPNAQVRISANSGESVSFHILCPDHNGFEKTLSGRPALGGNAFLISLYGSMANLKRYGVSATVLKNAENKVRLEGFVAEDHFERQYNTATQTYDTLLSHSVKYYFDVVKE